MQYKIIDMEQGSSIWLEKRKSMISATNVAPIMGLSPFKTDLALYEEKLGIRPPEPMNSRMAEGMALEQHALSYFNKTYNSDYKPMVLQHGEIHYLMASLDGMNSKGEILEIKCGKGSHELAKQGTVPEYYYSQVQCQLFCSNATQAHYFSYRSDDDNILLTVNRDDDFIEKMKIAVAIFYKMLLDFTPPHATDANFVKKNDDEWNVLASYWRNTKKKIRQLEEQEEEYRKQLIEMCNGQSCQGNGVRIAKTVSKGRINYHDIEELKQVDLEKYRMPSVTSYRFTEIKDTK